MIAGASSGMGLATAIAFARRGVPLVLAARRQGALQDAARSCEVAGSPRAIAVVADVTDAGAMHALAARAAAELPGLDLWVNMAGLGIVGRFEEVPMDLQARLIETNLVGVMNGCHAALPHMLRRGGGVIINMGSIGSRIPTPFAAAYAATKFGLRGFTEALRSEMLARSRIQVCGIYPQFVDTPALRHAANFTGRELRMAQPILRPDYVAERIVELARRPRRAMHLGSTHAMVPAFALAPETAGRVMARVTQKAMFETGAPAAPTQGALVTPVAEGTGMSGGWMGRHRQPAAGLALSALGLVVLGALLAGWRRAA